MQENFCPLHPHQGNVMPNRWFEQVTAFVTKYLAPAVPVLIVLGALWGIFTYTVKSEIQSAISGMGTDIGIMKTQVSGLETGSGKTNDKIDNLLKEALERTFPKSTASKAEIRGSLDQIDGIIKLARNEGIKLDQGLVERYGKQVAALQAVPADRVGSKTLIRLLDYRSFLNADAAPSLPKLNLDPEFNRIIAHTKFGNRNETQPTITTYGLVPSDQAAVINLIGEHLNLERTVGAAFIILEGDEVILDGLEMKNVIFRNVNIRYYGSLVEMENVYFVNCTFSFPPQSQIPIFLKERNIPINPAPQVNKQLLAGKILESPSVTFTGS